MKILVTGGTGYLGTHIRSYFDADDLSRRSGLDLLNTQDAQIAADYDVVIHLAACMDKSHGSAEEVFLTNVEGTLNLLRVMRPDSAFIFASTKDVYGRFADNYREVPEDCPTMYSGQTPLEWSKLIAERYVEYFAHQKRFRSCIFRISTVFAPATEGNTPNFVGHLADSIKHGRTIALPAGGRPKRDLLYVDDLGKAVEAFIDSVIRHGLYNIGGGPGNAFSMRELLTLIEDVLSATANVDENATVQDPVPMNYVSDIGRVRQELGWKPAFSVREGLERLFESRETEAPREEAS
jgi:CDP-paratose 2-epimerase